MTTPSRKRKVEEISQPTQTTNILHLNHACILTYAFKYAPHKYKSSALRLSMSFLVQLKGGHGSTIPLSTAGIQTIEEDPGQWRC